MKKSNDTKTVVRPSLLTILGILFITLKLTGYISWSWFWVLSPLLLKLILKAIFIIVTIIIITYLFIKINRKSENLQKVHKCGSTLVLGFCTKISYS